MERRIPNARGSKFDIQRSADWVDGLSGGLLLAGPKNASPFYDRKFKKPLKMNLMVFHVRLPLRSRIHAKVENMVAFIIGLFPH